MARPLLRDRYNVISQVVMGLQSASLLHPGFEYFPFRYNPLFSPDYAVLITLRMWWVPDDIIEMF